MKNALATTATRSNTGHMAMLPQDTTDTAFVALWLGRCRSPHTAAQYGRAWEQFATATNGRPLQEITLPDLQRWAAGLDGSPATVKVKIAAVKSLFSFALKTGYIAVNPASVLDTPTVPDHKKQRVLTEEQVIRMVDRAGCARDAAIIHTLYSSGCRVSELLALTWADLMATTNGKAALDLMGKGAKQREAGISASAHDRLLALRPAQAADDDPVFLSNRGGPLDRTVVVRMVRNVAHRAGIAKNVSPHWFRHSHATHALHRGASPVDVQEQLGHSSLATTTGYAHADRSSSDVLAL